MSKFYSILVSDFEKAPLETYPMPVRLKAEFLSCLEEFDADQVAYFQVWEIDTKSNTANDVTTDLAREMVDAVEWNWSEGRNADYRDTPLCAFILAHAEDYADEVFSDEAREAA